MKYHLLVDWDNDGKFINEYDNLGPNMISVETKSGRDYASQLTGKAAVGKLIAHLHDIEGRYCSMNPLSPLYGSLLPGRKVQLALALRVNIEGVTEFPNPFYPTINAVGLTEVFDPSLDAYNVEGLTEVIDPVYPVISIFGLGEGDFSLDSSYSTEGITPEEDDPTILWTGHLSELKPSKDLYSVPTVQLEAVGPLGKLKKEITPPAQRNKLSGEIIHIILDEVGWPLEQRGIDSGQTEIDPWFVDKKDALNAIRDIEETELGFLYESKSGFIIFEDRHRRLKGDHLINQATFSDDGLGDAGFRNIEYYDPLREIFNEVVATVAPLRVADSPVILWTFQEEAPVLVPGQSLTWWAEYPNAEVDPENGAYVDSWITPVAGTDIIVSGVSSANIGISVTKFANSMKITLKNNGSAPATITTFRARGAPVRKVEPIRVSDEDADSQSKYGVRPFTLPGVWLPNTNMARDFCEYIISRYKDPLPMVRMDFKASKNDRNMRQAIERKISDRVTIKVSGPRNPLGLNGEYFIESISHKITSWGRVHDVVFELSHAAGDTGYWILGVPGFSELGETTRLAY
jgi:hypothetical protein